ncbi:hypothetical protein OG937_41930 [Streptomyces sp. NBC_00510]
MKKLAAATMTAALLSGVPTVAYAMTPSTASAGTSQATAAAGAPATKGGWARVVSPGERVHAAPGVVLWLTEEGKHWSTPNQPDQFRSVVDGNIDPTRPSVSLQAEPVGDRYFLSGVYVIPDDAADAADAATVRVVTGLGTVTGTVVRLPGHPGWGAWYATSPLPSSLPLPGSPFIRSVTVFDAGHRPLATLAIG